ncbi:glucan biosynthesis protein [Reyranella sp.]|uniref:glucan biosynthesis protein n=1 Tax=Reyranella sp. TaxID=1929291 RepID=UPI003BAADC20
MLPGLSAGLLIASAATLARAQSFSFDSVVEQARQLAAQPYGKPEPITDKTLRTLTYDTYLRVQFRPEARLWRDSGALFRAELFPAGFLYTDPVTVFAVADGQATPVGGGDLFDFSAAGVTPAGPVPLAGVRLTYPLHGAKRDEVISFLGASYFRPLGRGQVYGASARGLAIDTGLARPEEFPRFRTFWLVKPADGAREATIWALLDTPAAAGAFSFTIRPGSPTVTEVAASLFMRHDVSLLALAPLTSMYLAGKNGPRRDDYRPEVHDSDGLLLLTGSGERLWRPLANPGALSVSSFVDRDPRGFGLLQRERGFGQYLDTQAAYHARPSLWVEPIGGWGEGEVRLLELPTDSEVHDNVSAFWVPRTPPRKGERLDLRYRLSAVAGEPLTDTVARVVATRTSALTDRPRHRLLVVSFAGGELDTMGPELQVEAVVSTSSGKVGATRVEKPAAGDWRMFIELEPDGSRPMDLRGFLRLDGQALTETWTYLLRP